MKKPFYIERTNRDGSYTVVSYHNSCDEAIIVLKQIQSKLPHGVWCDEWVNTAFGYAPIAWIN